MDKNIEVLEAEYKAIELAVNCVMQANEELNLLKKTSENKNK